MLILIAIFLASAVILAGMYMAYHGVRQRVCSRHLAFAHAAGALSTVILLAIAIFRLPVQHMFYNLALTLFIMALLGGLVLLGLRDGKRPPPIIVIILHALMGVIAYWFMVRGYLTL